MKKTALHLKTTLARAPIYDRAHPEKLWSASPGNPVGAPKHSLSLLFVQPDKKSLEESTSFERTYFLTYSSNKHIKSSFRVETSIKTHCYTRCLLLPQLK